MITGDTIFYTGDTVNVTGDGWYSLSPGIAIQKSNRTKPQLPPEYRWPQIIQEEMTPVTDVVVQTQASETPVQSTPVLAMAFRQRAMNVLKGNT